jgi:hypothetical protein
MSLAVLSASIYKSWRMSATNKRAVSRMTGIKAVYINGLAGNSWLADSLIEASYFLCVSNAFGFR